MLSKCRNIICIYKDMKTSHLAVSHVGPVFLFSFSAMDEHTDHQESILSEPLRGESG